MKIDGKTSRIDVKESCIHFYLNGTYIGMLTYAGELSDFRAVVRKKMRPPARDGLPDVLSTALSLMLRHYLEEETEFPVPDPNRERREVEDFFAVRLRKAADRLITLGYVK